MNYQERIVAYIDILGFSEKIRNTIKKNTKEEIESETNKINNFFENIFETKRNKFQINNIESSRMISNFSDSVVISYLLEEDDGIFHLFTDILFLCITVLLDGYLIRGAISSGKLHHSENNESIIKLYGPAMLSAYDMGENIAFYPRIIFEKEIFDIAEKYSTKCSKKTEKFKDLNNLIKKDFDGLYYINYFSSIDYIFGANDGQLVYLKAFKDKLIDLQKEINNNSVKSKYLWLKEKYNIAIKNLKRKYLNDNKIIECQKLYEYLFNEREINDE